MMQYPSGQKLFPQKSEQEEEEENETSTNLKSTFTPGRNHQMYGSWQFILALICKFASPHVFDIQQGN